MIEKIIETYEALNADLQNEMSVNDVVTRDRITAHLEIQLPHCEVRCDEENNPPDIIEACVAVARVQWLNKAMEITYVDLVFGRPDQIMKVQQGLT